MENTTEVRAHFSGCNIKAGKTVMQFELDPEYKGKLPQLAMMTGTYLVLKLTSDQEVLFVDRESGEVIGEQVEAFADDEPIEADAYVYEEPKALPAASEADEGALEFPDFSDKAADEPTDYGAVGPDWEPCDGEEAA